MPSVHNILFSATFKVISSQLENNPGFLLPLFPRPGTQLLPGFFEAGIFLPEPSSPNCEDELFCESWPLHDAGLPLPNPHPRRNLNSVASETKLPVPRSPRSSLKFNIFLTNVGSGRRKQYLFTGVKLRSRSLGHLEGGPNAEQQPQKPECAPLSSSPASGRGMEAAPRLSHSVVQSERQQRLRCCGCRYRWQKAEKK